MDNNVPGAPSTAARPDLDWSQVRETMLMLHLAMAQMEVAMHDSTGSVDVLTHSFTDMMGLVEAGRSLPDSPQKESIQSLGAGVTSQMQGAIVAFQFYDRLSQRLAHASHSLEDLTGIVSDPSRVYNPYAWHELQQKIRFKYTMEDEKPMSDTVLATGDVKQALEELVARKHQEAGGSDDIELF